MLFDGLCCAVNVRDPGARVNSLGGEGGAPRE